MNITRAALLNISLTILLAGCVTPIPDQYDPQASSIPVRASSVIDTTVEYVGPNNIQLDDSYYPRQVALAFPMVGGAIFGVPGDTAIFVSELDQSLHLYVDLTESKDMIDRTILPLSDEWQQSGLNIEPQDARIGRLGTFAYSLEDGQQIGAGGFIDTTTRRNLILLYVDRPCRLTGELSMDNRTYRHELEFAEKGFHWIVVEETSRSSRILKNHDGSKARFAIQIEDLEVM
jgi:hypothetical protein